MSANSSVNEFYWGRPCVVLKLWKFVTQLLCCLYTIIKTTQPARRWKMRQVIIFLFMFFMALILHNTAKAQPNLNQMVNLNVLKQQNSGYRFATLPLTSQDGLRHYRIYIAIPDHPAPKEGFPTFYALDGNAVLDFLTPANMQQLSKRSHPPVLILLGNAIDKRFDVMARAYDYTIAPANDNIDPLDSTRLNGGADVFLDFIQNQVMPAVQQQVQVNQHEQTLWGHSYGGLFVLHALLAKPDLFQHYIAADPSIWLHAELIQAEAVALLQSKTALSSSSLWILNSKLKINKSTKNPQVAARIKMRNDQMAKQGDLGNELISQLQQYTDLKVRYEHYPQENHGSMFGKSLQLALFQSMSKK